MSNTIIVHKRNGFREVADDATAQRLKDSVHSRLFEFISIPDPIELVDHDLQDESEKQKPGKKIRKSSL
jgi:hypothetical protein